MANKVIFDPYTRIITVTEEPVLVDGEWVVDIDVRRDLYSDGKEDWLVDTTLSKLNFPVSSVGGNPLPGSKALGSTFFLANDWKIRPYETDHVMNVNGNFYSLDGTSPFVTTSGSYNVFLIQTVSSLVDSTIQQLSEIEYASFGGAVWIDMYNISGKATEGTEYPAGNAEYPSNNVQDATAIAYDRGFANLNVIGHCTLDTGDNVAGYTLVGQNPIRTTIYVKEPSATFGTEFQECRLTGVLDGHSIARDCLIHNLEYVNGYVYGSILSAEGDIVLGGGTEAHFIDCVSSKPGTDTPVIDMGGGGQPLAMRNYNGGIKLINKTGPESVSLDINSGQVKIDLSTVVSGTIVARGIGEVREATTGEYLGTGQYGGLYIFNESMSKGTIAASVWDESIGAHLIAGTTGRSIGVAQFSGVVTLDVVNGTSGTEFPIGTQRVPVDNIPDAIAIATSNGIKSFHVIGNMTAAGGPFTGYTVYGDNTQDTTITASNLDCQGVIFENCTVTGSFINNSYITTKNCVVKDVAVVEITAHRTSFGGFVELTTSVDNKSVFYDCYDDIPGIGIPDIRVSGCHTLGIWNFNGGIKLSTITTPNTVVSCMIAQGRLWVDETCVEGDIIVKGMADLRGETGGTTIDQDGLITGNKIAEFVWDENIGEHLIAGSTGRSIGLAQFAGVIHMSTSGSAGTAFPIGTEEVPVNNMDDAVTIAATNGISTFHFIDNFTITGGTYMGYVFTGHGRQSPTLTFDGSTIRYCQFKDIKVTGAFNTGSVMGAQFCVFDDVSNISIQAYECIFLGTIILTNGLGFNDSNFYRCTDGVPGIGIPDIQVNTCASLGIWDWNGGIRLSNMTIDSAVTCMIAQGRLWVDETCVDGDIIVKGMADLRGETGGTTIDQTGLIDKGTIAEAVLDADITEHQTEDTVGFMFMKIAYANKIFLDTSTSNTGTDYPIGLPEHAVNNVDDARALMAKYECSELHIHTDIALDATHDFSHQYITGHTQDQIVTCTNPLVGDTTFRNVTVTGTVVGRATYEECKLNDLSGVAGHIEGCQVDGDIHFTNATTLESIMHNCTSVSVLGPTLHIYDETVICSQMSGAFTGANITTGTFGFGGDFCRVTLDASCTGGVAAIGTKGTIIDNSTGTFVALSSALTPETISDSVWSDSYSEYTTASGTMGYLQGTGGTGGLDEQALHDGMDSYPNKGDYKADTGDIADSVWQHVDAVQLTTDVEFIKNIEGGKWEIVNNQMIFYAEDSTTEIARFNLYNDAGVPGEENIYKRVRI